MTYPYMTDYIHSRITHSFYSVTLQRTAALAHYTHSVTRYMTHSIYWGITHFIHSTHSPHPFNTLIPSIQHTQLIHSLQSLHSFRDSATQCRDDSLPSFCDLLYEYCHESSLDEFRVNVIVMHYLCNQSYTDNRDTSLPSFCDLLYDLLYEFI